MDGDAPPAPYLIQVLGLLLRLLQRLLLAACKDRELREARLGPARCRRPRGSALPSRPDMAPAPLRSAPQPPASARPRASAAAAAAARSSGTSASGPGPGQVGQGPGMRS